MTRIVIDPVTRIEGHLRIDVEVDGGAVTEAWASGQMWRGIETILQGRDPREAWFFTQRICGVCTTVHAIASVRAVENALGLSIPLNAQLIRNLMLSVHALHDHVVHFYHLSALDWVDVTSALRADPAATSRLAQSLSPWPRSSSTEMKIVRDKLETLVASGQLGIFANGYWGHPAMRLPLEVNLLAVAHYLQALEYQRKANKVVAMLGGKTPNVQNLAVGGVANAVGVDEPGALGMDRLYAMKDLIQEVRDFVQQVYLPDVAAIGAHYPEWLGYGAGVQDYLAVPDMPLDAEATRFDLPGGTLIGADPATFTPIQRFDDPTFRESITESVAHAWYEGDWTRHPWDEETEPEYRDFDPGGKYSWVKAPRWKGRPMQVGPLAQVLVGHAAGHEGITSWLAEALRIASDLVGAPLGHEALHSTLGRHIARAVRCAVLADLALDHWQRLAENIASGDSSVCARVEIPPGEHRGFGFHEAPRGTLSHWVVIRDGTIANYQAVVPSTWNAGPRDANGHPGPYEASLVGNPVSDTAQPLEVVRTIHSFDPCLACAVHTFDADGTERASVRVL
jgi:hydrogenase large subunit